MKSYVLIPITLVSIVVSYFIWQNSPEYLKQGGPLLVMGLTFFLLTLTFAVERFIVLWRAGGRGSVGGFVKNLKQTVHSGAIEDAITACKKQGGSLANVIGAGLESYHRQAGRKTSHKELMDETRRALQEANALESPNLEENLNALSTIASIATMLGLLGTTIGMIRSFHAMSRAGAPDATQLALGISEALVNTALGLTTAIIATMLYNYFTTKVDKFNTRVEETSYEVLQLLDSEQGV
ncbi:MotA/TolQ/ExbB proton channel family protein [bacterium]|nr:MotA/TolQ/ExbB proton channel family protein [bacterium]PIV81759.1 MAG: flagellar motor protein MotA [bacterium CG17_big_fil_post_rev_8_21_14_2_50_64_8]PJA73828.1 MAG: flagellar motor protein MotA [bacterium CG_4_9_14_3_um_filter_65_15]